MKDELNPGDQEKESKKEEDISKKEKNSIVLIDAIKNLIANEIFSFASTSLLTIVSILVYRISYLRHCQEEKTLDLQHLYFNSIIFTFSMTAINLFATTIEKKLGLKHGHPLLKIRDPKIAPLYFKCSLLKNNK